MTVAGQGLDIYWIGSKSIVARCLLSYDEKSFAHEFLIDGYAHEGISPDCLME